RVGARVPVHVARELAVWAALAALALAFVRTQRPLALALIAFALMVRTPEPPSAPRTGVLGALVSGRGCGVGAAPPTSRLAGRAAYRGVGRPGVRHGVRGGRRPAHDRPGRPLHPSGPLGACGCTAVTIVA